METVLLKRLGPMEPWGFRLQGGKDYNQALSVQRVTLNTPAARCLDTGDLILAIGGRDTQHMTHNEAQDLIRGCYDVIKLTILRKSRDTGTAHIYSSQDFTQAPSHEYTATSQRPHYSQQLSSSPPKHHQTYQLQFAQSAGKAQLVYETDAFTQEGGFQTPHSGYKSPPSGFKSPPSGFKSPPSGYQSPPGFHSAPWDDLHRLKQSEMDNGSENPVVIQLVRRASKEALLEMERFAKQTPQDCSIVVQRTEPITVRGPISPPVYRTPPHSRKTSADRTLSRQASGEDSRQYGLKQYSRSSSGSSDSPKSGMMSPRTSLQFQKSVAQSPLREGYTEHGVTDFTGRPDDYQTSDFSDSGRSSGVSDFTSTAYSSPAYSSASTPPYVPARAPQYQHPTPQYQHQTSLPDRAPHYQHQTSQHQHQSPQYAVVTPPYTGQSRPQFPPHSVPTSHYDQPETVPHYQSQRSQNTVHFAQPETPPTRYSVSGSGAKSPYANVTPKPFVPSESSTGNSTPRPFVPSESSSTSSPSYYQPQPTPSDQSPASQTYQQRVYQRQHSDLSSAAGSSYQPAGSYHSPGGAEPAAPRPAFPSTTPTTPPAPQPAAHLRQRSADWQSPPSTPANRRITVVGSTRPNPSHQPTNINYPPSTFSDVVSDSHSVSSSVSLNHFPEPTASNHAAANDGFDGIQEDMTSEGPVAHGVKGAPGGPLAPPAPPPPPPIGGVKSPRLQRAVQSPSKQESPREVPDAVARQLCKPGTKKPFAYAAVTAEDLAKFKNRRKKPAAAAPAPDSTAPGGAPAPEPEDEGPRFAPSDPSKQSRSFRLLQRLTGADDTDDQDPPDNQTGEGSWEEAVDARADTLARQLEQERQYDQEMARKLSQGSKTAAVNGSSCSAEKASNPESVEGVQVGVAKVSLENGDQTSGQTFEGIQPVANVFSKSYREDEDSSSSAHSGSTVISVDTAAARKTADPSPSSDIANINDLNTEL